jgi:hypothetical protein
MDSHHFGETVSESLPECKAVSASKSVITGSGSASKTKFSRYGGTKMEPWRAVDAHNGGVVAQNGAMEGL